MSKIMTPLNKQRLKVGTITGVSILTGALYVAGVNPVKAFQNWWTDGKTVSAGEQEKKPESENTARPVQVRAENAPSNGNTGRE